MLHRWINTSPAGSSCTTTDEDLDAFAERVTKMPAFYGPREGNGLRPLVGGCWIFRGYAHHEYPPFRVPSTGEWHAAYLWLHEQLRGPLADPSLMVDHRCENKRCVNPDHLLVSTRPANVKASIERKRQQNARRRKFSWSGSSTK